MACGGGGAPFRGQSLWASGPLLDAVQMRGLFQDCKTFVDMPLREGKTPEGALDAFMQLRSPDPGNQALRELVEEHFGSPGSDLREHRPSDWEADPGETFLPGIPVGPVRDWALHVHRLWPRLCRQAKDDAVGMDGAKGTLLQVAQPFIVPGSRFREMYYWDSLWVVRGLLVSGMRQSAAAMVSNAIDLVERHGFVPNGSRSYYLNRGQPPLLSQMILEALLPPASFPSPSPSPFLLPSKTEQDAALLRRALSALQEEHRFFLRKHVDLLGDGLAGGRRHSLARYFADWERPRPESYREDMATASLVPEGERPQLFTDLASAAESGWDFSSRWLREGSLLSTIRTTSVIPADLNAFLYKMERNVASLAAALGDSGLQSSFHRMAAERLASINGLMWDERGGQWRDLVISPKEPGRAHKFHRGSGTYASNFLPLWCGCAASPEQAERVVRGLKESGLLKPGGIATSLADSGQQWDGDNGWPCLQSMIIEGLQLCGGSDGADLASDLARRWLENNFAGWQASGAMMEKYNVAVPGAAGGGGEYDVQEGFGWTNGVALELLSKYGLEWPPRPCGR